MGGGLLDISTHFTFNTPARQSFVALEHESKNCIWNGINFTEQNRPSQVQHLLHSQFQPPTMSQQGPTVVLLRRTGSEYPKDRRRGCFGWERSEIWPGGREFDQSSSPVSQKCWFYIDKSQRQRNEPCGKSTAQKRVQSRLGNGP